MHNELQEGSHFEFDFIWQAISGLRGVGVGLVLPGFLKNDLEQMILWRGELFYLLGVPFHFIDVLVRGVNLAELFVIRFLDLFLGMIILNW